MNEAITQVIVVILLGGVMLLMVVYIFDVREQTRAYNTIKVNNVLDVCQNLCPLLNYSDVEVRNLSERYEIDLNKFVFYDS